jgi:hypothetical protein
MNSTAKKLPEPSGEALEAAEAFVRKRGSEVNIKGKMLLVDFVSEARALPRADLEGAVRHIIRALPGLRATEKTAPFIVSHVLMTPAAPTAPKSDPTHAAKAETGFLEPAAPAEPAWLTDLNKTYFILREAGQVRIGYFADGRLNRMTESDFKTWMKCRRLEDGAVADAWLRHKKARRYDDVVFAPGQDVPPNILNLWQGFIIAPKAGGWPKTQAHIRDVICSGDDRLFEYLIGWMARMVQLPGEPGQVALVLRGGRGAGKGTLGDALFHLTEPYSLHLTKPEQLTGRFNDHLRNKIFLFADEAVFAGDRAAVGTLNGIITEAHTTYEGKGRDARDGRNCAHVLMASNDSWVVPAAWDERRYFVLDVPDTYKQDRAYFQAVRREWQQGGLAAMLADLLAWDISEFNVWDVPATDALAEQKTMSLTGPTAWLLKCLHNGEMGAGRRDFTLSVDWTPAGLAVTKAQAYEAYCQWADRTRREYAPQDMGLWSKTLRQVLGVCVREQRRRAKDDPKRPREFDFAPLSECRRAFEGYIKSPIQWETDAPETADK